MTDEAETQSQCRRGSLAHTAEPLTAQVQVKLEWQRGLQKSKPLHKICPSPLLLVLNNAFTSNTGALTRMVQVSFALKKEALSAGSSKEI